MTETQHSGPCGSGLRDPPCSTDSRRQTHVPGAAGPGTSEGTETHGPSCPASRVPRPGRRGQRAALPAEGRLLLSLPSALTIGRAHVRTSLGCGALRENTGLLKHRGEAVHPPKHAAEVRNFKDVVC